MTVEVKISFFKPTGFEDTHKVEGYHRGNAIKEVMAKYTDHELSCVNHIIAKVL